MRIHKHKQYIRMHVRLGHGHATATGVSSMPLHMICPVNWIRCVRRIVIHPLVQPRQQIAQHTATHTHTHGFAVIKCVTRVRAASNRRRQRMWIWSCGCTLYSAMHAFKAEQSKFCAIAMRKSTSRTNATSKKRNVESSEKEKTIRNKNSI